MSGGASVRWQVQPPEEEEKKYGLSFKPRRLKLVVIQLLSHLEAHPRSTIGIQQFALGLLVYFIEGKEVSVEEDRTKEQIAAAFGLRKYRISDYTLDRDQLFARGRHSTDRVFLMSISICLSLR